MRRFRPSYEQLHQMTEYSYQYIRQNATFYRTGVRSDYKPDVIRSLLIAAISFTFEKNDGYNV